MLCGRRSGILSDDGPPDGRQGEGRDESGDWPGLGADSGALKTTWAAAAWRPYDLSTSSVYVEWKRPVKAERLIIITTVTVLYCLSRAPLSTAYDKYGEDAYYELVNIHLHRICTIENSAIIPVVIITITYYYYLLRSSCVAHLRIYEPT